MPFTLMCVLRYLYSRRGFTRVVTGFSVAGIMVGVAALMTVMSVMAGFRDELTSRILDVTGHATLSATFTTESAGHTRQLLEAHPNILQAIPLVQGQVMLSAQGRAGGALLRAVPASDLPQRIAERIVLGDAKLTTPRDILIGEDLARKLDIGPGSTLKILSPQGANTPFGFVPKMLDVRVRGLFDTGSQLYDSGLIIAPLKLGQLLFRQQDTIPQLEIRVHKPLDIQSIMQDVRADLPANTRVTTWQETNHAFFNALQIERMTMFIILSLIILVAAFNIITGQIMLVTDKTADIAILRTMGASRRQILRIFLLNGLFLGLFGTGTGFGLGLLLTTNLPALASGLEALTGSTVFSSDVYPIDQIPAILVWPEIIAVVLLALVLTLLASLYPAWKASHVDVVKGLHHG